MPYSHGSLSGNKRIIKNHQETCSYLNNIARVWELSGSVSCVNIPTASRESRHLHVGVQIMSRIAATTACTHPYRHRSVTNVSKPQLLQLSEDRIRSNQRYRTPAHNKGTASFSTKICMLFAQPLASGQDLSRVKCPKIRGPCGKSAPGRSW